MAETKHSEPSPTETHTSVVRTSERDLAVTRTFNAPARIVFQAWTTPALFMQWWAPKSMGVPLLSCEMDVRSGGGYRIAFGHTASDTPMAFFGTYTEVVPNARLVWTNEENDEGPVTTVTFAEQNGKTLLVFGERHPSKDSLDASFEGMEGCMPEQFAQLDDLLATLGAGAT